jgi:hypothetical protein
MPTLRLMLACAGLLLLPVNQSCGEDIPLVAGARLRRWAAMLERNTGVAKR